MSANLDGARCRRFAALPFHRQRRAIGQFGVEDRRFLSSSLDAVIQVEPPISDPVILDKINDINKDNCRQY